MRYLWLSSAIILLIALVPQTIQTAQAQIPIQVNSTTPCFLNYSAGADMWRNCGVEEDYLTFAFLPWQWITGGFFSMILVGILIMFTYIKYHNAAYPLIIGTVFLPIAYTLFPEQWINWSIILVAGYFMAIFWYIFIRQTKEY